MENREQLITSIKEWVKLDNEIRSLQKEANQRKADKKKISGSLINVMKSNKIDCFDINDGQICYKQKSVKKPITQKVLLDILSKYFEGDLLKATEVNNYIVDNRVEETKEAIVRKINKPMEI